MSNERTGYMRCDYSAGLLIATFHFMLKPSPNTWSDEPLPLAMSATDAASGPTYAELMVGPTYAQIFGPVFWGASYFSLHYLQSVSPIYVCKDFAAR